MKVHVACSGSPGSRQDATKGQMQVACFPLMKSELSLLGLGGFQQRGWRWGCWQWGLGGQERGRRRVWSTWADLGRERPFSTSAPLPSHWK